MLFIWALSGCCCGDWVAIPSRDGRRITFAPTSSPPSILPASDTIQAPASVFFLEMKDLNAPIGAQVRSEVWPALPGCQILTQAEVAEVYADGHDEAQRTGLTERIAWDQGDRVLLFKRHRTEARMTFFYLDRDAVRCARELEHALAIATSGPMGPASAADYLTCIGSRATVGGSPCTVAGTR